jgi:hypothetical protein
MRRFLAGIALLLVLAGSSPAGPVTSLDQIQVWVGSGSNEAAWVIDWNNGQTTESLVWGYRWDGTATAEDMLRALAGANIGIYATVGDFGPGLGFAIFGLGFDVNQNGQFGVTPSLTFVDGIATEVRDTQVNSNRQATDPGDFYTEDWFSGFWSYWLSTDGANWDFSPVGISSEVLTNGDWEGWSFAAAFDANPPATPVNPTVATVAAPVPAALVLLVTACPGLVLFPRYRRGKFAE